MGRARGSPITIHMQSGAQYMVINLHSEIVQLLKKKRNSSVFLSVLESITSK